VPLIPGQEPRGLNQRGYEKKVLELSERIQGMNPAEFFLTQLKSALRNILQRRMADSFPDLIGAVVDKIEEGGLKGLSPQEVLIIRFKYGETFNDVRHANCLEGEQLALYAHIDGVLRLRGGWLDGIRSHVEEAMLLHLRIYNAFMAKIFPEHAISEKDFRGYLSSDIDRIFGTLIPQIINATFSAISEASLPFGHGPLKTSGLSYQERVLFASQIGHILQERFGREGFPASPGSPDAGTFREDSRCTGTPVPVFPNE